MACEWAPIRRQLAYLDCEILHRINFILDFDPIRPDGYAKQMASEGGAAGGRLRTLAGFRLAGARIPWLAATEPHILGERVSAPLLLRRRCRGIDLIPNVLASLDERYSDACSCRPGCLQCAQLTRLPGTLNRKGSGNGDRPHRRAELFQVGDDRPVSLSGNSKSSLPSSRLKIRNAPGQIA